MGRDLRVASLSGRTRPAQRESGRVSEESHLEEMRSAIRGDFARLAERRGDQELLRVTDVDDGPDADEVSLAGLETANEPQPAQPRRSWLARLVSP
jgi:hypothetical protein